MILIKDVNKYSTGPYYVDLAQNISIKRSTYLSLSNERIVLVFKNQAIKIK